MSKTNKRIALITGATAAGVVAALPSTACATRWLPVAWLTPREPPRSGGSTQYSLRYALAAPAHGSLPKSHRVAAALLAHPVWRVLPFRWSAPKRMKNWRDALRRIPEILGGDEAPPSIFLEHARPTMRIFGTTPLSKRLSQRTERPARASSDLLLVFDDIRLKMVAF